MFIHLTDSSFNFSPLKNLFLVYNISFKNHDLRSTCGRMMYRSGVHLEQTAMIFGYTNTKTTIHYIGLDFEDMDKAMFKSASIKKNLN